MNGNLNSMALERYARLPQECEQSGAKGGPCFTDLPNLVGHKPLGVRRSVPLSQEALGPKPADSLGLYNTMWSNLQMLSGASAFTCVVSSCPQPAVRSQPE